jgi:hypothetical protein
VGWVSEFRRKKKKKMTPNFTQSVLPVKTPSSEDKNDAWIFDSLLSLDL